MRIIVSDLMGAAFHFIKRFHYKIMMPTRKYDLTRLLAKSELKPYCPGVPGWLTTGMKKAPPKRRFVKPVSTGNRLPRSVVVSGLAVA